MLNQLAGYELGNIIDKLRGQDRELELEELIQDVNSRLAKSTAADRSQIEKQLQQAQSLLNELRALLYSQPGSEALAELRSDVSRILAISVEHERRLGHLEADVRALKDYDRNQEQRLGEIEKRLPMPPLGPVVTLQVGAFSSTGRSVPGDLQLAASELLAGELSRDRRVRLLPGRSGLPDLVVEGVILRYSVERRPYSGYGIRTLKVTYSLAASLRLLDASGQKVYLSKTYQRQKPEVFLDGVAHIASGDEVAHELLSELLKVGAEDTLSFIFREEIRR